MGNNVFCPPALTYGGNDDDDDDDDDVYHHSNNAMDSCNDYDDINYRRTKKSKPSSSDIDDHGLHRKQQRGVYDDGDEEEDFDQDEEEKTEQAVRQDSIDPLLLLDEFFLFPRLPVRSSTAKDPACSPMQPGSRNNRTKNKMLTKGTATRHGQKFGGAYATTAVDECRHIVPANARTVMLNLRSQFEEEKKDEKDGEIGGEFGRAFGSSSCITTNSTTRANRRRYRFTTSFISLPDWVSTDFDLKELRGNFANGFVRFIPSSWVMAPAVFSVHSDSWWHHGQRGMAEEHKAKYRADQDLVTPQHQEQDLASVNTTLETAQDLEQPVLPQDQRRQKTCHGFVSAINNNNHTSDDERDTLVPPATMTTQATAASTTRMNIPAHDRQGGNEVVQRQEAFVWTSWVGTSLIMLLTILSPSLPQTLQYPISFLLWALCTAVLLMAGPIYHGAYHTIIRAKPAISMDVWMAAVSTASYGYAVSGVFRNNMEAIQYFKVTALLISCVLLGKWLQAVMVTQQRALKQNRNVGNDHDGSSNSGMHTASRITATDNSSDTNSEEQQSAIDQVADFGTETDHIQMVETVQRQAQTRAATQVPCLTDQVAKMLVPTVGMIAFLTFFVWYILCATNVVPASWYNQESSSASASELLKFTFPSHFAWAVIVISCPCALGIAAPMAMIIGTIVAARLGIRVKSCKTFQRAGSVNAIIFDKAGSLTRGKPVVSDFLLSDGQDKEDQDFLLWFVGSLQHASGHPLAQCIVAFCQERIHLLRFVPWAQPSHFQDLDGRGASGVIGKKSIAVGNREFCRDLNIEVSVVVEERIVSLEEEGKTAILVAINSEIKAIFGISDEIKPDAAAAIAYLSDQMQIDVYMVTDDTIRTARAIGRRLRIPDNQVIAEALPAAKLEKVRSLQSAGYVVAMVGNGTNQSPALAQADLGLTFGCASKTVYAALDMVVKEEQVAAVCTALDLSEVIARRIQWNIFWSVLFNCLCIPLAAGVFYPFVWIRFHTPTMFIMAINCSLASIVMSSYLLRMYRAPRILEESSRQQLYEERRPENLGQRQNGRQQGRRWSEEDFDELNRPLLESYDDLWEWGDTTQPMNDCNDRV